MQIPIYSINNQEIIFSFTDDRSLIDGYEVELELHEIGTVDYTSQIIWTFNDYNLAIKWIKWIIDKMEVIEESGNGLKSFLEYIESIDDKKTLLLLQKEAPLF